ncbi:VanZ family protein [Pseudohalocynthiibacter aestuariivivens]|jgi:VanZ family protein|uniref:VanZ family protein n=1 Tax=Pseudohalocynthiibacter aestuariivivens TaxID=1591409 RepID=A0ABV5JB07_9RHOB|nr:MULTISPECIES: VanZ family protein [Pseudohalocynthiibacter]MBS9715808.1 VanZ family protein [Pseudohalocynthiibacter aestuariivivens]MCK0101421.1 VanZ family protein [Pseudohalocynthiibacter sp. F2068]
MSSRLAWIISIAIFVLITIGTLTPLIEPPKRPEISSDKLHHLVAFWALVIPLCYFHLRNAIWVLPAAIVYGLLIEIIQPMVGRQGEYQDFLADTLGAILGYVTAFLGVTIRNSRSATKS